MKLFISLALIVVACITTPVLPQRLLQQQQQQQQQAQYCVTPENGYGTCVTLSYCPLISNFLKTASQTEAQQYEIISQRACNTRSINGDHLVCCVSPLSAPQATQRPQTTNRSTGSYCRDPDTEEGSCMPIRECLDVVNKLKINHNDQTIAAYLRLSKKICGNIDTNVCCPNTKPVQPTASGPTVRTSNEIPKRLPTLQEGCGFSKNNYRKIVGGEVSKKGAWPWVALIGYDDELSASPFKCGGTLITARHVLTAAHCLLKGLSFVRLGEHDLSTDTEAHHEDIPVVKSARHPDYNRRSNRADIAILYLERNVLLKDHIAPICLPATGELRRKSWLNYSPFVVGWGRTMEGGDSSNVLQELQIPIYENEVCKESYRQQSGLFTEDQFDEAVLCAGVLAGGKDTCQGDSGGPLMVPEPYNDNVNYYLIGVVSYGIGCSRLQIPSVFASTQYFMDWIIEKVADTP